MGHCRHAVQQAALGLVLGSVRRSLATAGGSLQARFNLAVFRSLIPGLAGRFKKAAAKSGIGKLGSWAHTHSVTVIVLGRTR